MSDVMDTRLPPDIRAGVLAFFDTPDFTYWSSVADLNAAAVREAALRRYERMMARELPTLPQGCRSTRINGDGEGLTGHAL